MITHNGAYIAKDIGKPIHAARIEENTTYDLVRLLEGFSCQIRLVHEHYSLANKYKLNHNLLAKTVFTSGDPVSYSRTVC